MPEQGGDGFEAHAAVEALGGQGVAELVRMHWPHPGPFGDAFDVAVDGAPVEGVTVFSFEQIAVA
jgi:hypothetical protein